MEEQKNAAFMYLKLKTLHSSEVFFFLRYMIHLNYVLVKLAEETQTVQNEIHRHLINPAK
jgi:hypothetical protein